MARPAGFRRKSRISRVAILGRSYGCRVRTPISSRPYLHAHIFTSILECLKIDPNNYLRFVTRAQKSRFHGFTGSAKSMRGLAGDFGRSFLKGQAAAAPIFSPG